MERFQSTIEVDAPASVCYEKWHHFEQFPHFMAHVNKVEPIGENRWHWVVSGPLGKELEWDAEIDGDEPDKLISWHTVSEPDVGVQGAVRFDEVAPEKTQVTCTVQYEPPAGGVGSIVAHIFSDPQHMVNDDLKNFKNLVEGTNVPTEKAHEGKVMHPDPFVVPNNQPASASGVSGTQPSVTTPLFEDEDDYEAVYGLEDELPIVGTSADIDEVDIVEIQALSEEESPYLGSVGAIYSEDVIDMRADQPGADQSDVYTESMDVFEEDLESFYEDIDEELDEAVPPPRQTIENYSVPEDSGALVNPSHEPKSGGT
jgi:hypothetical protein